MTATAPAGAREALLRGGFPAWLGAATVSATGDGVLYFAIVWTASGLGAATVTLILTAGLVPEAVLTLFGGAAADRWGLRRTIVGCNLAMCALLLAYLGADRTRLPTVLLLGLLLLGEGVVNSLHRPANGVFPRLFFADDVLARAMSLVGTVLQVARLVGPPLGGVVVGWLAMTGAVSVDLASFAVIVAVLLLVRPPHEAVRSADGSSAWSQVRAGLAAARAVPGALALLAAVALVAGTLIPMLSLCVPLLGHARGWGAGVTGGVEASWIAGSMVVSLVVVRNGPRERPFGALATGPVLAALGVLVVAAASVPVVAFAGAAVMGMGTVVFTSHAFPLYVLKTPEGMLARFQALLLTVQMVPMLAGNVVLGSVAARLGPAQALLVVAGICALAGVIVAADQELRASRL